MFALDSPVVLALTTILAVSAALFFSVKLAYQWRLARRVARWDKGLAVNRYF